MFQKIRHTELELYLREPIHRIDDTCMSPEENVKAKMALVETLNRAREMLPWTCHVYIGQYDRPLHDCSQNYLFSLLVVKKSLKTCRWSEACSNLLDVLHYFHIEDGRVLNTIIKLLEANLS